MNKLLFLLMLAAFNASCATAISDSKYPVTITSDPSGAHIKITDEDGTAVYVGNTPSTVILAAGAGYFDGQTYSVEASLPGHASVIAELDSSLDTWIFGNLLIGGLLGAFFIDPTTGAMWELPEHLLIYMNPREPSLPTATF